MEKNLPPRRDKLYQERTSDRFSADRKAAGEAYCQVCGVHYHHGNWAWGAHSDDARSTVCPACQRIAEAAAAGIVDIPRDFFLGHREDLTRLIQNTERAEKSEHPLERLIAIEEADDAAHVTTTGPHLADRIAHAITRQFGGHLRTHRDDHQPSMHIAWTP